MAALDFEVVPFAELKATGVNHPDTRFLPVALVVDDETVIANTLCAILRASGFTAYAAYEADSALELAQVIPPDVLITDVVMPGKSGVELAIAVRRLIPDCRILLFSGLSSIADVAALARERGHVLTVLAKPVHPKELLAQIAALGIAPSAA